jgi:hypothetical protein
LGHYPVSGDAIRAIPKDFSAVGDDWTYLYNLFRTHFTIEVRAWLQAAASVSSKLFLSLPKMETLPLAWDGCTAAETLVFDTNKPGA